MLYYTIYSELYTEYINLIHFQNFFKIILNNIFYEYRHTFIIIIISH